MECVTQCTRCDLRWEGDFEYCLKCEPVLAQAERRGIKTAFIDQEPPREGEEDVRLRRGRILTPVEQEKLIVLIDRFMDYKAINTARHSQSAIDETACEIEELLTKAGWYPDVEEASDGSK